MCSENHLQLITSNDSYIARDVPNGMSSGNAPQGDMAPNMLRVLGFGLSGAIMANTVIFVFFIFS
jgi:hypothetical protein